MSITVTSKPRCPQCDATYRAPRQAGAPYEKIDVTQDVNPRLHQGPRLPAAPRRRGRRGSLVRLPP